MRERFVEKAYLVGSHYLRASLCSASIERAVLVYIRSVYVHPKYKLRSGNIGRDDFLLN